MKRSGDAGQGHLAFHGESGQSDLSDPIPPVHGQFHENVFSCFPLSASLFLLLAPAADSPDGHIALILRFSASVDPHSR